jgi:hypothetical protein
MWSVVVEWSGVDEDMLKGVEDGDRSAKNKMIDFVIGAGAVKSLSSSCSFSQDFDPFYPVYFVEEGLERRRLGCIRYCILYCIFEGSFCVWVGRGGDRQSLKLTEPKRSPDKTRRDEMKRAEKTGVEINSES